MLDEHCSLSPGSESFGFDSPRLCFQQQRHCHQGSAYACVLDAVNEPPNVPSNILRTFDVVQIRLLIAGVAKNHPRPVLRNALALLKLGGFLQWTEIFKSAYTLGESSSKASTLAGIVGRGLTSLGIPDWETSWMVHLPQFVER